MMDYSNDYTSDNRVGVRGRGAVPLAYYQSVTPTTPQGAQMASGFRYPPDIANEPCSLNFQVDDAAVGSIIGKAGANLQNVIDQTGARITVSKRDEVFPGNEGSETAVRINE
eukprot:GHVN01052980.1.p1 GENE.GHVN01052980.1~~GHVN01052980.1.p1  ORF type:complete len:112 (+),score=6.76 GHVN01052980.1:32-367(+)